MSTTQTDQTAVRYDKDADGIVTLTLDDPTGSANVMNDHYRESMHNAVEELARLAAEDSITGVVVTSAKKTFFAGGDLGSLIILPGGEVGTLLEWWNAEDGSEWRWRIEFYNHR